MADSDSSKKDRENEAASSEEQGESQSEPQPKSAAKKPQFKVTQSPFAPKVGQGGGKTAPAKQASPAPSGTAGPDKPKEPAPAGGSAGAASATGAPAPRSPLDKPKPTATAEVAEESSEGAKKKAALDRPAATARRQPVKKPESQRPGAIDALEAAESKPRPAAIIGLTIDFIAAAASVAFAVFLALELTNGGG
jgi:hypothetical protein